MNVSAHTFRRLVSFAGLAAVVAAVAVPTALARPATDGGDDMSRTRWCSTFAHPTRVT